VNLGGGSGSGGGGGGGGPARRWSLVGARRRDDDDRETSDDALCISIIKPSSGAGERTAVIGSLFITDMDYMYAAAECCRLLIIKHYLGLYVCRGFLKDQLRTAHVWTYGEHGARAYNGGPWGRAPVEARGQNPLKPNAFLYFATEGSRKFAF